MSVLVTLGQFQILEHLSKVEECLTSGKELGTIGTDTNVENLKRYYNVTLRSKWDNKPVSFLLNRYKEGKLKVK